MNIERVRKGESLSAVAKRLAPGVTGTRLVTWTNILANSNGFSGPSPVIYPGQYLFYDAEDVPTASGVEVVRTPGSRPFSAKSPFNIPTDPGTVWYDTWALHKHWWAFRGFSPVFAKDSDPEWKFVMPNFVALDFHRNRPAQTLSFKAPDNLAIGGGTDKLLMVVQPDGSYLEMWRATLDKEHRTIWMEGASGWATGNYYTGLGVGDNDNNAGVRAANYSWAAGLVTPEDITSGVIDHALAVLLCSELKDEWNVYRAPATAWDNASGQRGPIAMGSKIGIPLTAQMPSDLSTLGQMVFKAFQKYGGYVGDYVGGGWPGIQIDDRVQDDDFVWKLYAHWGATDGKADFDKMHPFMKVADYQP